MPSTPNNAFLRSLAPESLAALQEHLTPIDFAVGATEWRAGDRTEWVYFPESAVVSALVLDSDGRTVEAGMVGAEGAVGLVEACGSGLVSIDAVVQVDGRAWRVPASVCRRLVDTDADFSRRAWSLTEYQLSDSRQTSLCNAMHLVERRFPRWLLESHDRSLGRNPLPLRQEFIAAMLGVQRTTVTLFASRLQETGMIAYRRGRVELLDLAGLEERACECLSVARDQRARLGLTPPRV